MVYQGLLTACLLLGCLRAPAAPPELLEADGLAQRGKYRIAAIYFMQYRMRFPAERTYCTERAAYCMAQYGDLQGAIRLLYGFDDETPEPVEPKAMIARTRLRYLLARLYDRNDEPRKALRTLLKNPTFGSHAERNLHILHCLNLRAELEGISFAEARRQLILPALLSPPGTPGRWTMLCRFIEYGGGKCSIPVEKILKRDYSNYQQKNNQNQETY